MTLSYALVLPVSQLQAP